ncbi:MAG: acyl-ACP--UDP-N-acetylglucosamine O-acyltransferase [Gammaproteobacteria bacterium]|nr:acyl-ACP--UDP-N-acetylglucosamine O-acyltransferase [Gammaproteobacteria bacterium]TVQ43548.1 MAG: acyl-ACP--UDP-N-acetylglucosamine O-acyltransferase [Gammaproteobacteria bacterium]
MIDPRAIVSPGARVHDSVAVGPFSIIDDDVEIGAGTVIGPHVVIRGPTVIGEENRIFQFTSLGEAPQDKKYAGEPTRLVIGNRNTIREFVTINRGTAQDRGETTLGDDNWIMAYVHIAHDCVIGNQTILANAVTLAGHVVVDDWAILGGFSGAHQFCHIGAHAFLGMQVAAARDVPAYLIVTGNPPEPRGVNQEGLRRRGFTPIQIRNIREAYKVVYRQQLRLEEAVAELEQRLPEQPELGLLLDSLKRSERGILR